MVDPPPTRHPGAPRWRRVLVPALVMVLAATIGPVVAPPPASAALVTSGMGKMFYWLGGDNCVGVPEPAFSAWTVSADVTTWSCEGNQRQKWNWHNGNQLRALNNLCLGMINSALATARVRTVACAALPGRQWTMEGHPGGGHWYSVRNNAGTKLCLEARQGTGLTMVPWVAPCANIPAQRFYLDRHNPFRYVALGDSFSAGNGAGNYLDTKCYNSWNNYANKLDDAFAEQQRVPPFTWPFGPSCSGAQIGLGNLAPWAPGGGGYFNPQHTESGYTRVAQSGFLNQALDIPTGGYGAAFNGAETSVVTITIGGNDLGFAGLLYDCTIFDCLVINGQNTEQVINAALPILEGRLFAVYLDIGRKAPNARIRVPNYPLPVTTTDPLHCRAGMFDNEAQMLARVQAGLNQTIATAVTRAQAILGFERIRVVDIATPFRTHTACAADPWTTGSTSWDTKEWYHVNARGHLEMARLIRNTL
ncbi:GDSL-type esterase/lipase family protein [Polymorphospora rubra]|uniref:GDSL-type esterase/lipase family protein n=1 Tax=Polymorphospora rubra TaxID=338584 RepID=UPI0033E0DCB9